VVPLPPDGPLHAATIAAALDTGLPLGPGFDRIEKEVEVRVLREALPLCRTDHARERISVLLAGHSGVAEAIAALPELVGFLPAADRNLRNSAAYAIATIAGRAGAAAALSAEPNLAAIIRDHWRSETDAVVRDELQAALGVLGEPPLEPRVLDAERFVEQVREAFGFLVVEYGFGDPTVEDRWSGTTMTYRNETTAVVASADWRDSVVDVFLVPLRQGVLPESLNGVGNSLTPSLLLELLEGTAARRSGRAHAILPGPDASWSVRLRPSDGARMLLVATSYDSPRPLRDYIRTGMPSAAPRAQAVRRWHWGRRVIRARRPLRASRMGNERLAKTLERGDRVSSAWSRIGRSGRWGSAGTTNVGATLGWRPHAPQCEKEPSRVAERPRDSQTGRSSAA
jgi:hypothetical protein